MKTINTVTGEICASEIGLICIHEHLLVDARHEAIEPKTEIEKKLFLGEISLENVGLLRRNPYVIKDNLILDNYDDAISEIEPLRDLGCNLLIDVTSVGIGRDTNKLKEISKKSGMSIVCGCGLFVNDSNLGEYRNYSVKELANLMISEIESGIQNSSVRAGVIGEIGTSKEIYPIERISLLAAAIASNSTELPIYLHIYPWSHAGLEAIDILLANDVPEKKICICHLDVSFDMEYIFRALDKGVYVEFDNIGKEFYFHATVGAFSGGPFETDISRARMLKNLIGKNYTKQLLLANDVCIKSMLHKYGGWGYDHLFTNFLPMMEYEGIDLTAIEQIIKHNPVSFLFEN